ATIVLDDQENPVGLTPFQGELKLGSHKIKLLLAGHQPFHNTLDVKEGEQPQEFTFELTPISPPPPGRSYALLVGVRQGSKDLPSFQHAEADVATLARVLLQAGYRAEDVVLLTKTRGDNHPRQLPSAERIRQEWQRLLQGRTPADTVLLVWVGHIVQFPN